MLFGVVEVKFEVEDVVGFELVTVGAEVAGTVE
jgi:hypothetical protein